MRTCPFDEPDPLTLPLVYCRVREALHLLASPASVTGDPAAVECQLSSTHPPDLIELIEVAVDAGRDVTLRFQGGARFHLRGVQVGPWLLQIL